MKELSNQLLLEAYVLAKKIGLDEEFIQMLVNECMVRGLDFENPSQNEP